MKENENEMINMAEKLNREKEKILNSIIIFEQNRAKLIFEYEKKRKC